MVANANLPSNLMSIPATSAHLWPAGTLPAGSVTYPGRIFVGGLTSERNLEGEVKEEDLINFFATFGKVTEVKKILDHEDGTFRGFAFVTFADKSSADKVFELYSDASQRHQFVIKGMDLKIGHAVKKGNGPSGITNPAGLPINPLAAQLKLGQSLYNQQLLAAQLYCNPYSYLGVAASPMPVSPDPMLNGGLLYATNPAFALPQPAPAAVVPSLPQVKLSTSPVATQSLASPVSVSSALLKPFEGQDSPTSRNGFPAELSTNDLATAVGINPSQASIPMTQGGGGMMSPLSVASTDVLNLASTTSPALINSYGLRCPNPLAYPYGCMAAPALPGLTSTQTQPACNGLDQNYLNSFYCFPQNGAFLGSPVASLPGQIPAQNIENQNTGTDTGYPDAVGNKTSTTLPLIPEDHVTKAMGFPPGVVTQPSMPVQFANTSCVENLSLAGISRPLATTME